MQTGAEILSIALQGSQVCIWALVSPKTQKQYRKIICHGTGHPVREEVSGNTFIGTVLLAGGTLVFHFFDGGWGTPV